MTGPAGLLLRVVLALCLALASSHAMAQPGSRTIILWGPSSPIEYAEVIAIDERGVTLSENGIETTVGWHRVQLVRGENLEAAAPYISEARTLWRAVTRLDRGDAPAAEPLFEEVYPVFREETGPTASAVAEGLMRCRLRRGFRSGAIEPWLVWMRAAEIGPGQEAESLGSLRSVIDTATGVTPELPPFWIPGPATRAFAESDVMSLFPEESREAALAAWYVATARAAEGLTANGSELITSGAIASDDPGVRLVREVSQAVIGNASERAAARQSLITRIEAAVRTDDREDDWIEVWSRIAVGRSLLAEDDAESQRQGLAALLHGPARFRETRPWLAGYALAVACSEMERLGDTDAADALRAEFRRVYPDHPARDLAEGDREKEGST